MNIDETGWKDKGIKYWAWVFCSPVVSFFWIAKSRSSKVLKEILGETYDGTIVSDFFGAYVKYANKLQQFCLAHLIRDIKFLTTLPNKSDKDFGDALLMQFKKLFRFWHQRDKIPKDQFDRWITQGSRSLMDRQWNARIWTVLDTCRKQGRSTWDFLQHALYA